MKKYARYLVVLGVTLAAHGVCAEEVVELWQGQPPHFKSSTLEEYVEEAKKRKLIVLPKRKK